MDKLVIFFSDLAYVSVIQRGRRHHEILPRALNWQNCVYAITWKPASGMLLMRFNDAEVRKLQLSGYMFHCRLVCMSSEKNLDLELFLRE